MAAQSKLIPPDRSLRQIVSRVVSLYGKHRRAISFGVYLALFLALAKRIRNAISEQKAAAQRQSELRSRAGTASLDSDGPDAPGKKKRVELNREFLRNLLRLLRIIIPGPASKEARLLLSHSVFLVLRTVLSIYVAELDGRLVSNLVRGKGREFLSGLVWWMIVAVPATFTNSMVSCILAAGSWQS